MTPAALQSRFDASVFEATVYRTRCEHVEAENDRLRLRVIQLEDYIDGIGFTPPEWEQGA